MNTSLNGFNSLVATFSSADAAKGDIVSASGNMAVSKAAANAVFCGVCTDKRGGFVSVQLSGYTRLSYSGTAPTVGFTALAADGNGGVKAVTSGGRSLLVTDVDTTNKTIGVIL